MKLLDGTIQYSDENVPFLQWDFKSETISAQITAFLATFLSLLIVSIIFELFFGTKPAREAQVSDLFMLLLTRRISPRSIGANVLRWKVFSVLYHGPDLKGKKLVYDSRRIKPRTILKLVTILMVAPVVNILVVFLTLSTEKKISFQDASFGGIALKVGGEHHIIPSIGANRCYDIPIVLRKDDVALSAFYLCIEWTDFREQGASENSSISLLIGSETHVAMSALVNGYKSTFYTSLTVSSQGKRYFIKPVCFGDGVNSIMEAAFRILINRCRKANSSIEISAEKTFHNGTCECQTGSCITPSPGIVEIARREVTCPEDVNAMDIADEVLLSSFHYIGIANTDAPLLTELYQNQHHDISFWDGSQEKLLLRRRRRLSPMVMLLMCLALVFIHMLLLFFVNNDLDLGIELIVKAQLGLHCCESLLQCGTRPTYPALEESQNVGHQEVELYI